MGRKTIRHERLTRREKILQERDVRRSQIPVNSDPRPISQRVPHLEAKTQNQRTAIEYLVDGYPVVFLTGSAGTGKSMLAAWRAAVLLQSKKIDKLFLVRPAVAVGKSIGLLPGEIEEKLGPYFAQTIAHLERFLGKAYVAYALEKKIIEMKPVEYLRGMSFEDCMVICEEVQNFTAEEMEMMLTRIGDGCTMVFTGDTKQHDLKGKSGLVSAIELIDKMLQNHPEYMTDEELDDLDDGIAIVRFTPDDVVRSGLTKALVKMFYHNT